MRDFRIVKRQDFPAQEKPARRRITIEIDEEYFNYLEEVYKETIEEYVRQFLILRIVKMHDEKLHSTIH
ncbi:hypothetical protein ES702_03941 [subsurface metagenome]